MMRAARYHGREDVRVEVIPEPHAGPEEVTVAVAYNGLCGTDLHEYLHGPRHIPDTPHPLTGAQLPLVLGHEFFGTISEVGSGVDDLMPGDRVCVEPIYSCGRCAPCLGGHYNLCRRLAFHGVMSLGGGLAELAVVPASMVHRPPDEVALDLDALVEPTAVAMHVVLRRTPPPSGAVVVFGAGAIGVGLWYALRACHACDIVVVEPTADQWSALIGLGADRVIDPAVVDPVDYVQDVSSTGAAIAYDAARATGVIDTALRRVGVGGVVVSVALHPRPVPVDPGALMRAEAEWKGSLGYTATDFEEVIALMAVDHYRTDVWVEHVDLDDVVTAGLEPMATGRSKMLVDIGEAA
jgi:(R,R)-butanediol dehydrogenase/meso-butanediol dehydrogenase/diacetyl reductase